MVVTGADCIAVQLRENHDNRAYLKHFQRRRIKQGKGMSENPTYHSAWSFTMDDERLKNLGGGGYWKELLDRIRDIRSSEKVTGRIC